MGWLHSAMLIRQPFTFCVYVHALERRRERQKLKLAYRRLFTINRGTAAGLWRKGNADDRRRARRQPTVP